MKQENNTTKTAAKKTAAKKTSAPEPQATAPAPEAPEAKKAPREATAAHDGTPKTADRAGKGEQPAKKSHLGKLKKLFEVWIEARKAGAAEALLESGSVWAELLKTAGLSVIDGQQDVSRAAQNAAQTVAARYDAAKTETARKALPVVVAVITQDNMQPVPIDSALLPLLPEVKDPAALWSDYDSKVRSRASAECELADILPFVSARGVLTVEQIADRLPVDRRDGAGAVQAKVESVLRKKSEAYRAYASADLRSVKTRGLHIVHTVDVTYTDGAARQAK